jgi:Fur family peroxide stress response transcriptional regulator
MTVQQFMDVCRDKGLNVTYQRTLIYKTLISKNNHPTAEEIYQSVKAEYPSISLATVYKTLEILADMELIAKVTLLHDLARYDGDTTPHQHLVCLICKKIVDIRDDAFNSFPLPAVDSFKVYGYRIQFEGICESCALTAQLNISQDDDIKTSNVKT